MMHIESVRMDDHGFWLQPKSLVKKFNLSRPTLYRLLAEMRTEPEFSSGIIDLSQTLHLVNLEAFMNFLRTKDKQYLKA